MVERYSADDFVYTFTRLLHPRTASPRAWLFERVQGAKEFLAGTAERVEGLQALDAYTLQITLSQPYAPFISILGMVQAQVVPREEVERLGSAFGRQPVGTGPFRFVNWVAGEKITLEANEEYFEGRPFLDHLHYRIITDRQRALAEFEQGALEDADTYRSPTHTPEKRSTLQILSQTASGHTVSVARDARRSAEQPQSTASNQLRYQP